MRAFLKLFIPFTLSVLLIGLGEIYAQMTVSQRYEIPTKRQDEDDFEVVPLSEEGLILINLAEPWKYAKEKEFKISFLNKELKIFKEQSYILPYIFTQGRYTYYDKDKYLYFFVQDQSNLEISIFQLQVYTGEGQVFTFTPPVKIKVNLYYAIDDYAYIVGEFSAKPVVMSFNFLNQSSKVLPAFYENKEEVVLVQTDMTHKQIYFVVSTSNTRRCEIVIKPYSQLIGIGNQMLIKDKGKRTTRDGLIYTQDNLQKMVLGTYAMNCAKTPQGVYVAKFENGEQKSINYNKFTDFGNFFSYYGEKGAKRWQKRIEKKRKKGKELNLNRKIDLHEELIEYDGQLIMLLEGYYNSTANDNTPIYGFGRYNAINRGFYNSPYSYGRNFYPYRSNPNLNFQYNYAIICSFDTKGRLLWDNAMAIEKVETRSPQQITELGYLGDSLILSYIKDSEIYSKSIYRYNEVKEETKQEIKLLLTEYGVSDNTWGEYIHWYDNHYLLFGEQRLKAGASQDGGLGKKIFHITKLSYEILEEETANADTQKELKDKKKRKEKNDKREK